MVSRLLLLTCLVAHHPPLGPERWLLVYTGSGETAGRRFTTGDLLGMITHVDPQGRPLYRVFTGVVLLQLSTPSRRSFLTWLAGDPARPEDWHHYLDSLFAPDGMLARLDSAATGARATLGPTEPLRISIMIPYPASQVAALAGDAPAMSRDARVRTYVNDLVARFQAAQYSSLQLDGAYWLREEVPPEDIDLVKTTAALVRARGLRLFWIPYYRAQNWDNWRALGFDVAWLQPNYFFDPDLPVTRLDSAAALATETVMGLEIEFDGRAWSDPAFAGRLEAYLATLDHYPGIHAGPLALYEGGGALDILAQSHDPARRALYDSLDSALR